MLNIYNFLVRFTIFYAALPQDCLIALYARMYVFYFLKKLPAYSQSNSFESNYFTVKITLAVLFVAALCRIYASCYA